MKVAVVTGGSRGIGAATVTKFAKEGYTVIAVYNNGRQQAEAISAKLNDMGCDVHPMHADLSDPKQIANLFAQIGTYFKKIDVLVNNAAMSVSGLMQDIDLQTLDKIWAVNARAPYLCCANALPLLQKNTNAAVVNVSSVWGLWGASCEAAYSMTKHAVIGLTRSVAEEWNDVPVRVCCVCPSFVRTDMTAHYTEQDIALFEREYGVRAYTPEEVATDIYALAVHGENGTIKMEK